MSTCPVRIDAPIRTLKNVVSNIHSIIYLKDCNVMKTGAICSEKAKVKLFKFRTIRVRESPHRNCLDELDLKNTEPDWYPCCITRFLRCFMRRNGVKIIINGGSKINVFDVVTSR